MKTTSKQMTAVRIYRNGTRCEYGKYNSVIAFLEDYRKLPDKWQFVPDPLAGHASGCFHADDGSYIALCN